MLDLIVEIAVQEVDERMTRVVVTAAYDLTHVILSSTLRLICEAVEVITCMVRYDHDEAVAICERL